MQGVSQAILTYMHALCQHHMDLLDIQVLEVLPSSTPRAACLTNEAA
jgi:hypothetical protein